MKQIPLKHGTVVFNQRTPQSTQPPQAGVCAVRPCCWPLPQNGVMCGCRLLAFAITVIITLARRHGSSPSPPPVWRLPGRDAEERDGWGRGYGEVVRLARKESDEPAGGSKRGQKRPLVGQKAWLQLEMRKANEAGNESWRGVGGGGVELISTPVCRVWRTQHSLGWGCNYGGLGSRGERESHKQIIKTNLNKVTPTGHFIGTHPVGTG